MEKKTETYMQLAQHVIKANRDMLDPVQLRMSIGKCSAQHPCLENLRIDDELNISGEVPEGEVGYRALSAFIDTVYDFLAILVGEEEAKERIKRAAEGYLGKNWAEALQPYIPVILSEEAPSRVEGVRDDVRVFEHLFSLLLRLFPEVKEHIPKSEWFEMKIEGEKVTIIPQREEMLLDSLIETFDETVFSAGKHLEIKETVLNALKKFEDLTVTLDIRERILRGLLASRVEWGMPIVDAYPSNRIPKGKMVVLEGPHCIEREIFVQQFLRSSLEGGAGVLLTLTTMSPREFTKLADMFHTDLEKYKKQLRIVDWYSFNERRVVGVERENENVIVSAGDLTNLGMAIDEALKGIDHLTQKKAIVDIVSPAVKIHGFDDVYNFIQFLRTKFMNHDVTSILLVNHRMHQMEEWSTIQSIVDGLAAVTPLDGFAESFNIVFMDADKTGARYPIKWVGTEMILEEEGGLERETISFGTACEAIPPHIENLSFIGKMCEGDIILSQGLHVPEYTEFHKKWMHDWILDADGAVVCLSNLSPEAFLKNVGIEEAKEKLTIVDWYSYKSERIVSVEAADNVIKSSQDLTHLGIAIERAIEGIAAKNKKRAFLDIISPALQSFEFRQVYSFFQAVRAKLKEHNITSVFFVDKEMHDRDVMESFQLFADTVIDSVKDRKSGAVLLGMPISRYGGSNNQYFPLVIEGNNIKLSSIAEKKRPPTAEVARAVPKDEQLERFYQKLKQKEQELKKREEHLLYREEKLRKNQKEFMVRINLFQDEVKKWMQEREWLKQKKEELEEEEERLRAERAEIKRLWEALSAREKMVEKEA